MRLTVKQARLVKGLTQRNMAEKLNVHVQTYRAIEQNPENASIAQAKIISEELGLSLEDLFFGDKSTFGRENANCEIESCTKKGA